MVKKLHIKENLVNLMDSKVYDNIALLGYACTLAANDLHHIHLCAVGDKFQEIHTDAENYMDKLRELGDFCFELAKEGGLQLYNETNALEVLKDAGNDWKVLEENSYDFDKAYENMSDIFTDISKFIMIIQKLEGITSDVSSKLDEYLRDFTKIVNYFIEKKLDSGENDILVSDTVNTTYATTESLRGNRKTNVEESYHDNRFKVTSYFDNNYRGAGSSEYFNFYDEAEEYAHDKLINGENILITDTETGNKVMINSSEYIMKFDGDFEVNKDIYDFRQSVIKSYQSLERNRKSDIKESYKDSKEYKKLAEYDYICEVDGNKVIIKWADDGAVYAEFTLTSPEEMFADTDIDPYDDFGKAHGFDCWVIDDGNGLIDTYAKTYDDAIVAAINYFWSYY